MHLLPDPSGNRPSPTCRESGRYRDQARRRGGSTRGLREMMALIGPEIGELVHQFGIVRVFAQAFAQDRFEADLFVRPGSGSGRFRHNNRIERAASGRWPGRGPARGRPGRRHSSSRTGVESPRNNGPGPIGGNGPARRRGSRRLPSLPCGRAGRKRASGRLPAGRRRSRRPVESRPGLFPG
jgi:hypothetical protein